MNKAVYRCDLIQGLSDVIWIHHLAQICLCMKLSSSVREDIRMCVCVCVSLSLYISFIYIIYINFKMLYTYDIYDIMARARAMTPDCLSPKLALPIPGWIILGKLHDLFVRQFLHL